MARVNRHVLSQQLRCKSELQSECFEIDGDLGSRRLAESFRPGRALVSGQIDSIQAEKALAWIESVLRQKLDPPILTDAPNLWRRLSAIYPHHPQKAAKRFSSLYANSERDRTQEEIERLVQQALRMRNKPKLIVQANNARTAPNAFILREISSQRIDTDKRSEKVKLLSPGARACTARFGTSAGFQPALGGLIVR